MASPAERTARQSWNRSRGVLVRLRDRGICLARRSFEMFDYTFLHAARAFLVAGWRCGRGAGKAGEARRGGRLGSAVALLLGVEPRCLRCCCCCVARGSKSSMASSSRAVRGLISSSPPPPGATRPASEAAPTSLGSPGEAAAPPRRTGSQVVTIARQRLPRPQRTASCPASVAPLATGLLLFCAADRRRSTRRDLLPFSIGRRATMPSSGELSFRRRHHRPRAHRAQRWPSPLPRRVVRHIQGERAAAAATGAKGAAATATASRNFPRIAAAAAVLRCCCCCGWWWPRCRYCR